MPAQYPRGRFPIRGRIGRGMRNIRGRFKSWRFFGSFSITGVTRDGSGAPIAGCTIYLFDWGSRALIAETISDGAGAFTFVLGTNAGPFRIVADDPVGGAELSGTTLATVAAT